MRYRQFFHNDRPTDRIDSTEGEAFGTPDETALAEVAAQLGVSADEISVGVRSAVDSGSLVQLVAVAHASAEVGLPPAEGEDAKSPMVQLLEAIAGAEDLGELKAAALTIAAPLR